MWDAVRWVNSEGLVFAAYDENQSLMPGKLRLIDQTKLPAELVYLEIDAVEDIFDAIKRLLVRGAPAIGCAAALGLAAAAQKSAAADTGSFLREARGIAARLNQSRPTAVNLFWALERCLESVAAAAERREVAELKNLLLREALDILAEDISMCRAIGFNGAPLLSDGMSVLTHCNAGALATGDYGTALAPIYVARERGVEVKVFADETRPLLQGSRLTAFELNQAGVDVTVICDSMAAQVMREGKIDLVIVGSDRIAANGDAANKIGTYGLAVLAEYHNIPFYVAAPSSTIDTNLADGGGIPIEQRDGREIGFGFGKMTAPAAVGFYNPAFDVTPSGLITGIITDKGLFTPPYDFG